jgi:hypothetical protein
MSPGVSRVGRLRARYWASAALVLVPACSRDIPLGSDQVALGGAGRAGGGAGGSSAAEAGTGGDQPGTCTQAPCLGRVYACGDCDDNDQDGLVDAADPECTGPCDNREDSLDVGLPGSGSEACQEDCFFDRGAGSGQDGCRFSHQCDPLSVAPDYPPTGDAACAYDESAKIPGTKQSCEELRAAQADSCAEICGPLTPNGCDCFGCCELPAGSGSYQWLATGLPCAPVPGCLNACEPCERCVGRPEPLASCGDPSTACPTGYPPCNPSAAALCKGTDYCITGCCIPEPR